MPASPVLSDLDGTVIDTQPAIFASLPVACADVGVKIDPGLDLSFCLGAPLHWCLGRLGVPVDVIPDAIVAFERAHIEMLDLCSPMPGVREVFKELHDARIPIGIVTIKPEGIADLALTEMGLHGYVTVLMARTNDLDARTKTDLLQLALDHPDLSGNDPIYMGDTHFDEEAARDLDVPFLRYPDNSWTDIRTAIFDR
jgi:phosphoglycolate phosphatase